MEGKNFIKVLIKMVVTFLLLIVIFLAGALLIMQTVQKKGEKHIVSIDAISEEADAIIVLGAGVKDDGTPSDILVDRLKTAIEVNKIDKDTKLLLSGDHGREGYNEVKAMKEYVLKNSDIKEENIFLDHAGFSTYDTIYRAKEIFQVKKAIIITNEYHLPRALYLAEKMEIESIGVKSDIRNYLDMTRYVNRERVAQVKDYLYCNVFKAESKYLGEPIPVNTSDGKITDDEV